MISSTTSSRSLAPPDDGDLVHTLEQTFLLDFHYCRKANYSGSLVPDDLI